jgi:hypothetical protein
MLYIPALLAQMAGGLHQQQLGLLPALLSGGGGPGGGGGGILASPAAKSALAGIMAMAVKQLMGKQNI